jgi:putative colanic acid biosynthesis glycosyltransferase
MPLLTVICVTFKDVDGILRTLNSLDPLRPAIRTGEIEVLVIDGGTGEEFEEARPDFEAWCSVVSERDEGIYDAMNKGLRASTGHFVWFLNGGDESAVADWAPISALLRSSPNSLVLGNYELKTAGGLIKRASRPASYIWHALPTSHQAILYPGPEARTALYDRSYRVVADYEFTARLLASGLPSVCAKITLARFHTGGLSSLHAKLIATEATRVQSSILGSALLRRLASRAIHTASRTRRKWQG